MSAEPMELILGGGAGAGGVIALWKAVEWLVAGRLKKAEKAEEQVEVDARAALLSQQEKLNEVLTTLQKMDRELGELGQQISNQAGSVSEVKNRIDGISANYGQRLAQLEQGLVELRTHVMGRRRR